MRAILLGRPEDMKRETADCPHVEVENLGFDRNAKFLRCLACGRIVVVQGGRAWVLRPTASSA